MSGLLALRRRSYGPFSNQEHLLLLYCIHIIQFYVSQISGFDVFVPFMVFLRGFNFFYHNIIMIIYQTYYYIK